MPLAGASCSGHAARGSRAFRRMNTNTTTEKTMTETMSTYANDSGLGFLFSSDPDDDELHRASDVGGSEIIFRCDLESLAIIEAECESDDHLPYDIDGDNDGSDDRNLCVFWARVESIIRRHASEIVSA